MGLGGEFGKLWTGSAVSNLGDGISFVAIPLLAATLTDSATLVAGLSLAFTLPRLLVSVFSGALVDRMDRRRLMTIVNLARGGVMGVLFVLVAVDLISMPVLYAVFVVLGLLETVADTSAFSVLPTIVPARDLDRANGRLSTAQIVCDELLGPPLGGLLFGVAAALPVLVDAASFAIAGLLFLMLRGDFRQHLNTDVAREPMIREIGHSLRWLGSHRLLRLLTVMLSLTSLAYMLPFSVLVLFATGTLRLSPAGYGIALAVSSLGGLAGSFVAPYLRRKLGTAWTIGGTLLLGAAAFLVIAATSSAVLFTAMLALYFFYTTIWSITVASLRQTLVPDEQRGRVAGANKTLGLLGLTLGSLGGGLIADAYGLRAPLWVAGGLLAATAFVALPVLHRAVTAMAPAEEHIGV
ncbi:MFS transporter [Winogradskya consettensis]|uniref:MFS transporter n=1 Tax=Winogradskya consettensis TaxID=113560 RepID=A0A919SD50_9ACTN|nr:MFS transporter [Actinoplanes consettensis]GIM69661.1 MFS transporter [Actinoplanes consettensis]